MIKWGKKPELTHFQPTFHFYTPRKHQKTYGFLVFSGEWNWNIGWKCVNLLSKGNGEGRLTLVLDTTVN